MAILAVNAGSSTLKFALYPLQPDGLVTAALLAGSIEGLEAGGKPRLAWRNGDEASCEPLPTDTGDTFSSALQALQRLLHTTLEGKTVQAIAHRVVHGGEWFRSAVRVNDATLAKLGTLCALAPLHQPHNLEGIRSFARAFPDVPQVACFDTAFHADLPEEERLFALPEALTREGIRRYGFHGLSYQFLQESLQRLSPRWQDRVLMAHLGNGASLCATLGGQSCATTMGFSALDGLMMGTRSGAIDAGVLLHLLAQGWSRLDLEKLLYRQSGLLGVSGIAADMRQLRASQQASARRAIHLFTHRVVREAGAMAACLGGLDLLAFTGGIGEHDGTLRAEVCERLQFLGVQLDPDRNNAANDSQARPLHAESSRVEIWMIPTDEGRMAAQAAADLCAAQSP